MPVSAVDAGVDAWVIEAMFSGGFSDSPALGGGVGAAVFSGGVFVRESSIMFLSKQKYE
jgi:hypothetical protein